MLEEEFLQMENQHGDAGPGAVIDDPDQQVAADEAATLAATLEAGAGSGSWYWTSMLNFSQSGSSSTHTSAGQVAASQFAGSPPSCSSVHMISANLNTNNNTNSNGANNHGGVEHGLPLQLDSMLASSAATACNDPAEHAVWGQEFLSGPIGETKASMHACADDGLQELLYPRTVRELLLDQSPSWDLLQQAAISKSFGFPLGPEDHLASAQLHALNSDIKPAHHVQGLHYGHDDRLSSSTASSTLSDNTQHLSGTDHHHHHHWPGQEPTQVPGRACPTHVPHSTLLQNQFDQTRVKQEYPHDAAVHQLNPSTMQTTAFAKPSSMHSLLLQHQQQQQRMRLISCTANPDQGNLFSTEAAMAAALHAADVKPSKQLHSWPTSPSGIGHLVRSPSSLELASLHPSQTPGDPHQLFLSSMKQQQQLGAHQLEAAGFNAGASPTLSNLMREEASFFQSDHHHHHQLMQQAAMQAHHHAGGGSLQQLNPSSPLHYLNQSQALQVGLKKGRAHIIEQGGNANPEQGKDLKAINQRVSSSIDDYAFKRPRVEPHQQQQQQQQQQQSAPASTSSFKSQPVRKEKLGERITTLQQLVSPFGKTDTASVLLEAIGYIKFLQEQVQTLSSPYLKSTNNPTSQNADKNPNGEDAKPDLRSKGLCLVPLSCTMQVANDNGADFWYGGAFR